MQQAQYWNSVYTGFAYLIRVFHIVSSIFTCCLITINVLFENILKKEAVSKSLESTMKWANISGIVMNVSGFALVYLMRASQKSTSKNALRKAQS